MKKKINDIEDMESTFYNLYNKSSKISAKNSTIEKEAISMQDVESGVREVGEKIKNYFSQNDNATTENQSSGSIEESADKVIKNIKILIPLIPSLFAIYKTIPTKALSERKDYSGNLKERAVQFGMSAIQQILPGLGMVAYIGPRKVVMDAKTAIEKINEIRSEFTKFGFQMILEVLNRVIKNKEITREELEKLNLHLQKSGELRSTLSSIETNGQQKELIDVGLELSDGMDSLQPIVGNLLAGQ